jgi:hypothetical protein
MMLPFQEQGAEIDLMTKPYVSMFTAYVVVLIVAGCTTATVFPATYSFAGGFGSEEIEFRPDHTFAYHANGDNGPSKWAAMGTWQWKDKQHRLIETHLTVWLTLTTDAGPAPLRDPEVWTVLRDSALRKERVALKRVTPDAPR